MRFVQPDSNRIGSENRRPTSNGIRDTFSEEHSKTEFHNLAPRVGFEPCHALWSL